MIRLSFNETDKRVTTALRAKGPKLVEEERRTVDLLMLQLQKLIQKKLSGEVLQPRTSNLVNSINKQPTTSTNGRITGRVTGAGGTSFYGIYQEKGSLTGEPYDIYPKNKLALAFFPGGSAGAGFGRSALTQLRFAAGPKRGSLRPAQLGNFAAAGGVVVKHVVHPPIVARPFMKTSLQEMQNQIIKRVRETALKVLKT